MKTPPIFLLLFFTTFTAAQPGPGPDDPRPKPRIVAADMKAKAGDLVFVTANAKGKVDFFWDEKAFPPGRTRLKENELILTTPTNGTYKVRWVSYADMTSDTCVITVTGGLPPDPTPPPPTDPLEKLMQDVGKLLDLAARQHAFNIAVDARLKALEGPRPPPIPPVPPDPKPDPAPIPLAGFRVLIVYDKDTLTASQQGIVFGKKVRDYLQSHCVVGPDGKTKDFWILQAGLDVSAAPKWLGDVIQRHPGQRTFMVVSNGVTGSDGPIPANADEALSVLTKVGGP